MHNRSDNAPNVLMHDADSRHAFRYMVYARRNWENPMMSEDLDSGSN